MLETMDMNGAGIGGIIGFSDVLIIMVLISIGALRERGSKWKRDAVYRIKTFFKYKTHYLLSKQGSTRKTLGVVEASAKQMGRL